MAFDVGSTAGLNATVLSIAVAVGAVWFSLAYANLRTLEERIFATALSANDIVSGPLLLNTLGSQGDYHADSEDARTHLMWRVFRIVSGSNDDDLPQDDASRGRESLLILSHIVNDYPFGIASLESITDVEAWMSDMFSVVRGPGTPLFGSESELRRLVLAFGEDQKHRRADAIEAFGLERVGDPVVQAVEWLETAIRAMRDGDELAKEVRSLLHQRDDVRRRLPRKRLVIGSVSITMFVAVCGVILPMVWSAVPWWVYSALPATVYALLAVIGLVFVASRYTRSA
jgi:hypothetical protein